MSKERLGSVTSLGIPKVTEGGKPEIGRINFAVGIFGADIPKLASTSNCGFGKDKFRGTPKLSDGGNPGIGGMNFGVETFALKPKFVSISMFGFGKDKFKGNPKFRLGGKLTGSGGKGIATENEYS
jgi:hypothetical protein